MALNIQSEIYLDVQQRNIQKVITAHQYDKNSRYILAHIIDNGEPLDVSSYDILFKVHTQDDRAILIDDCEKQSNIGDVVIKLSESLMCSAGKHMAEVVIYDADEFLTTMKFTLIVEGSVYSDDRITSSDDFSALARLMENADIARNIISEIESLEADIEDAKDEIDGYANRIASIQSDISDFQSTVQSNMNTLQSEVQDNIDESDTKLAELEAANATLTETINGLSSTFAELQDSMELADDLIDRVGNIVLDDSAVRKTQLGIATDDYNTGVATLDRNGKLVKPQFPYEFMTNDDADLFIRNYNGLLTVSIDGVPQERNIDFVTVSDVDYGDVYLIV